ncbi:MAG TPA: EAL domain-containing protein [Burkholderiales bacterium]
MANDTKPTTEEETSALLELAGNELAGWSDPVARLRQALDQDELRLFCQPIVALRPGEPYLMAEILVRLLEEEVAHLPPGDFLPVFEHFGMMPKLDRWVVAKACALLARNHTSGFRHLGINLASQTLRDAAMPNFIARTLEQFTVPPNALCFEIDERDVLGQPGPATAFAAQVRKLGCRVAIDAFGHRAVSFAPLKALQVDFLKVDGAITRNLLRGEVAQRKMQAIVRVGEAIGFGVIAEFVEDAEIIERLRALGVGYAQGFGIARPAPLGDARSVPD